MCDAKHKSTRIAELEQLLIRAQAEVFARQESLRIARSNVSYLLGAIDESKRSTDCAPYHTETPVDTNMLAESEGGAEYHGIRKTAD